jgi:hypothetical protein
MAPFSNSQFKIFTQKAGRKSGKKEKLNALAGSFLPYFGI